MAKKKAVKKSNGTLPIINVAEVASKLLEELDTDFNNVPILNIHPQCIWHEQYATFIWELDSYFELDDFYDNNYVTVEINTEAILADQKALLKEKFPGCEILVHCDGTEFEVIGPHYKEWSTKHGEELENFDLSLPDDIIKKSRKEGKPIIFTPKGDTP